MRATALFCAVALSFTSLSAVADVLNEIIIAEVAAVSDRVVAWRRDTHANPELSNREFRTFELFEEHLHDIGIRSECEGAGARKN